MARGGKRRSSKKSEDSSDTNGEETETSTTTTAEEKMETSELLEDKEEVQEKVGGEDKAVGEEEGEPPNKKSKKEEVVAAEEAGAGDKKEEEEESSSTSVAEEENNQDKKKSRTPELEKFWKAVTDDASDFTGWTYLLQYVDQNSEAETGREAFDAFLHRYPYCYGYWKKYADFEKKKGTPEKCMMVFERGIKAIPLSADLWIHYLNHVKTEYETEFVRAQYERAVEACGREWRSDKLWDHYVKWEMSNESYVNVLKLYDRIIRNPTQGLSHQFDMFRDFVKERNPKDILDPNAFLDLRKEVLEALSKDKKSENEEETSAPGKDDSEPKSDEENLVIREKIIFARRKVFKETEDKVQARWKYEDQIKRPYFHMKPLERGQLKNWSDYLDYEIKEAKDDDYSRVEILFERCLIACALYEEFWIKYVDWLSSRSDGDHTEFIREVYRRVCEHHLPNKVEVHLRRAGFEERMGNLDKSSEIYGEMEKKHPELMSVVLRRINLERRRSNNSAVHELYKSCLDKKSGPIRSEIAIKYARFTRLHLGDDPKAASILNEAIEMDEKNSKLYLQLLDLYVHSRPLDLDKIIRIFDTAVEKSDPHSAVMFSQRKVEFLEDFGTDIHQLAESRKKHDELMKKHRESLSSNDSNGTNNGVSSDEGKKKTTTTNGSSTMNNSASYEAHHNNQYQQYGSRYASSSYYGTSGEANYYQGYSGSYGSSY